MKNVIEYQDRTCLGINGIKVSVSIDFAGLSKKIHSAANKSPKLGTG
jgi:hypothetical protein